MKENINNKKKEIGGRFNVKYTLAFLLLFFSVASVYGMDGKEILKKMGDVYQNTTVYEFHMRYDLFKGEKGTNVETTYNGYFVRNKTKTYQKIDQTEFITTPSFCLKISHSEKLIELMQGEPYKNRDIDFEQTIKECKEIKVEEKDQNYLLTLNLKTNSQVPYTTVKVLVNKTNYHLVQLDLYYWHFEDFSKNPNKKDLQKPHVRITYSKYSKKPALKDSVFTFETYFKTVKNILSPIGSIQSYELIDNRVN